MYTEVIIEFADDHTTWEVVIKADCVLDEHDDEIFFYGLTREDLLERCDNHVLCEGEWYVIAVGDTWGGLGGEIM